MSVSPLQRPAFAPFCSLLCAAALSILLVMTNSSMTLAAANSAPNIIVLEAYPITKGNPKNTDELIARMRKVLQKANIPDANLIFYPWNRGLDLLKGKRNTIVFPIDKTKDRDGSFQWIAPLLNVNLVMVSRNRKVKSIYDAVEFDRILVRSNSNYEYILRQFGFSNISAVSSETMHQMLSQNRAEAWFTSDVEARQLISSSDDLTISDTLGVQKMWLAATPDVDKDLVAALQSVMENRDEFAKDAPAPARELTIASVDNADMQILQELSSIYLTENPGLKINWNLLPENQLRERVTTDILSSENEFDLVTIGPYELAGWGRKGWLRVFNHLPKEYDLQDLFKRIQQSMSLGGDLLALPFYSETILTYYRKDLLTEARFSMPKQPTYLEIAEIAKAIHDPDNGVYGICLRGLPGWGQNMAIVTSLVKSFNGHWYDENWQTLVKSAEWRRAMTFYIDLMRNYGPPNASKLGHIELTKMFSQGKCGIWVDASVFSSLITDPKRSMIHDQVGIALAPHQETDQTHWLWYWALAIPAQSSNQTEARKFAIWATSQDYIKAVVDRYGWQAVPPGTRLSTYNADYEKNAPYSAIVKRAMSKDGDFAISSKPSPHANHQFIDIPEFQLIGTYAGRMVGQMLDGTMDVDTGLDKIYKKSVEIMSKAGYN